MVREQDIKFGFREHRHGVVSNGEKGAATGSGAPLQRKSLSLGEFDQLLAYRYAAGWRIEQWHHHRFGLFGVEVENQRLDRAMAGGRQRQRTVTQRDQRQRADRLRRHLAT